MTNRVAVEIYSSEALEGFPEGVASFGCGNPVALASLKPGQVVVDLGSGAGLDCFLASKAVGPSGHVIGVDFTPAMLEQARANQAKLMVENVSFRQGDIESLPVAEYLGKVRAAGFVEVGYEVEAPVKEGEFWFSAAVSACKVTAVTA